jgi:hypothetical protein
MYRKCLTSTLALFVAILAGCSSDPGRQPSTSPTPEQIVIVNDLKDYPGLEWESLAGTLTPPNSGAMGKFATTWDRNCWFGLVVPESAVDPDWGPIDFEMKWPTKASYLLHPELNGKLLLYFDPDGVYFLDLITVVATWMPWEGAPPADLQICCAGECYDANITFLPSIRRHRITAQVPHFSDWEVEPDPTK